MAEKKVIFLRGKKYSIVSETDRYWICGKTAFRKSNPDIEVRTEPQEVTEKQEKKKAEKKEKKSAEKPKEELKIEDEIPVENTDIEVVEEEKKEGA